VLERRAALGAGPMGAQIKPDVGGPQDRLGVAPLPLAPAVEDGVLGLPLRGAEVRGVPAVGVAGDRAKGALLPGPADPDPCPLLDGLRVIPRVLESEVLAVEVGDL